VIESDVIVIGAGIIGAACAWQLAKRGQRVTLIDDGQRRRDGGRYGPSGVHG
jgi:glycine/D-amino acid oxidase-like deaminating enzyme